MIHKCAFKMSYCENIEGKVLNEMVDIKKVWINVSKMYPSKFIFVKKFIFFRCFKSNSPDSQMIRSMLAEEKKTKKSLKRIKGCLVMANLHKMYMVEYQSTSSVVWKRLWIFYSYVFLVFISWIKT